jgi:plasmid stabilization system protein ParE
MAILAYDGGISPVLADEFWAELEEALRYAREFPKRHHFDPSGRRRGNLSVFPYQFLFRIIGDSIRVTAVRHNNRNPKYGARRK